MYVLRSNGHTGHVRVESNAPRKVSSATTQSGDQRRIHRHHRRGARSSLSFCLTLVGSATYLVSGHVGKQPRDRIVANHLRQANKAIRHGDEWAVGMDKPSTAESAGKFVRRPLHCPTHPRMSQQIGYHRLGLLRLMSNQNDPS